MAKQTFTTGQVLTAAQMTSLQQTAMLGGAASAKTASYTLVAADAGTAISMSNASATTITVNTALFAAGDTVQITNLGAGVCTITAGTATVNTSASLALAQYESGTLDFTSTSAAIFIKGAGAAAAGGGMTSLASGSLSSTSLNLTSIDATYNDFVLVMRGISTNADASLSVTVNGTASIYRQTAGEGAAAGAGAWNIATSDTFDATVTNGFLQITAFDYANTSSVKTFQQTVSFKDTSAGGYWTGLTTISAQTSSAISQITVTVSGGNTFDAGTYTLWGVK